MHEPPVSVAVIGGGILGMALAGRLRDAGLAPTILEASNAPGGLTAPAAIGSYTWDRFYHVILLSDLHLRQLLDDLGLSSRIRWRTTGVGFYTDGRLHSLSSNLDYLKFRPLSLIDKARLAATILLASRTTDPGPLEEVLADTWLLRRSGRRVFEKIWLPLLKAKLGENHRIASAAFIWAIIARLYAARRSGMKREMFGYVDGGYAVILQALQALLEARGVPTLTGWTVSRVHDDDAGVEVQTSTGLSRRFDAAVFTLPCSRIAEACPQLSVGEQERLRGVVYQGIACASMLTRHPLANFYVTNITDGWVPFTGVIEMTSLVERERFGGNSLIYLPRYMTQDDPYWDRSDAEIRDEFLHALERMYPHFRRDDVLAFHVSRAREMLAVTTLRYTSERLPPVSTSLPHVFIANSAQIAAGTLNVNETLGVAYQASGRIVNALRSRSADGD